MDCLTYNNKIEKTYKLLILIKTSGHNLKNIKQAYLDKLNIKEKDVLLVSLPYPSNNKLNKTFAKPYLDNVIKLIDKFNIKFTMVADGPYFKFLTKVKQISSCYGYVYNISSSKAIILPNFTSLFHNPALQEKIDLGLTTLNDLLNNNLNLFGQVSFKANYPKSTQDIEIAINSLNNFPVLAADIETTGLSFQRDNLLSIAFAVSTTEGIAFLLTKDILGKVKEFLTNYKGKFIWHNASFDLSFLIRHLWMNDTLDNENLIQGLDILLPKSEDTQLISYLCLNSTAGNSLSLKELAFEYLGNYGVDTKNITELPTQKLLEYNLKDTLATFYIYNKYLPILSKEQQDKIYIELFKPSLKTIIHMQLSGMPMDMNIVESTSKTLKDIQKLHQNTLLNQPLVKEFTQILRKDAMDKKNAILKKKRVSLDDFAYLTFNPNSNAQVSKLLFEYLDLPILNLTDSGSPSVDGDTIKQLLKRGKHLDILEALFELTKVSKLLTSFIPAFLNSFKVDNGYRLHGNFNLTGTKSMRLSSNNVNLQNLPSTGTSYAKLIKKCFKAPTGWVMVGADFNALEARIDALTTKDPNKLTVYTDGFDSHCLNSFFYFRDQMPDIEKELQGFFN